MQSKLYIPHTIVVGFQERADTFTGYLGYVIYKDEKNVLRKETSWNNWRNPNLGFLEIPNTPQTNFVLNKGILRDGYWHNGHNQIRVYDSRDFEFEINVNNLLHILMHSDVSKREIEVPCVYAWNGTELVLLPTNSLEYIQATAYTEQQYKKLSKRDLKVGYIYRHKKTLEDYVYMGKLVRYHYGTTSPGPQKPEHVFYALNPKTSSYGDERQNIICSGTLHFNEEIGIADNFPEIKNQYLNSIYSQEVTDIKIVPYDSSKTIPYYIPQSQNIKNKGCIHGSISFVGKYNNKFFLITQYNYLHQKSIRIGDIPGLEEIVREILVNDQDKTYISQTQLKSQITNSYTTTVEYALKNLPNIHIYIPGRHLTEVKIENGILQEVKEHDIVFLEDLNKTYHNKDSLNNFEKYSLEFTLADGRTI